MRSLNMNLKIFLLAIFGLCFFILPAFGDENVNPKAPEANPSGNEKAVPAQEADTGNEGENVTENKPDAEHPGEEQAHQENIDNPDAVPALPDEEINPYEEREEYGDSNIETGDAGTGSEELNPEQQNPENESE